MNNEFSNVIFDRYNKRCFKGIEINKNSNINKKIVIGKKGIPIKYEEINIENENLNLNIECIKANEIMNNNINDEEK